MPKAQAKPLSKLVEVEVEDSSEEENSDDENEVGNTYLQKTATPAFDFSTNAIGNLACTKLVSLLCWYGLKNP